MSTYEAVVQAVALLEGEEVVAPLLDFYRRAVDRMLLVRGHLRLGEESHRERHDTRYR
jgi:hypothetical protein